MFRNAALPAPYRLSSIRLSEHNRISCTVELTLGPIDVRSAKGVRINSPNKSVGVSIVLLIHGERTNPHSNSGCGGISNLIRYKKETN